jgi:signal transduction histidine kinase
VTVTAMPPEDVVDRLVSLPLFESVPRAELEWLSARGEVHAYGTGTVVHEAGAAIEAMSILLAGRVVLNVPKGGAWRTILEAGPGYVLGVIPYSRYRSAPGNVVVEDDVTALVLHRRHFVDLVRDCPELTAALVHQMLDRARDYRTIQLHDERMQSLGRLASGLAHELNNPASAAARNAESLAVLLDDAERAARSLAAARLTEAQLEAIDAVRAACTPPAGARSALEAADREDDIAEWLTRHAIDPGAAATLAASAVTLAALDRLADALPPDALGTAIGWAASGSAARELARQIASATRRMHDLVAAVKGFTFMDREGVPEAVDVAGGLADTIAMLESKSRAKSVTVRLETADDLPRVYGFGSEINQVWEKLIDNAIDAAGPEGTVTITASVRGDAVIVKVMDGGRGILEEHRARIFDPFFTTKPVGQGTGLGLDLARRLVHLHHGDIDFTSQPGRTVFRVRLPVDGAKAAR